MNYQTAKIIAESYRKQAVECAFKGPDGLRAARMLGMEDHAAVWQRVADALLPLQEASNVL